MFAELRTLIAVARHGTFSSAGEHSGLTQAAVSGQMKRLEEWIGFSLFTRTGRSAILNEDGIRTVGRAKEIIALFDAIGAPDHACAMAELRIGKIGQVEPAILAGGLALFRERFANTRVFVTPGISIHLLDQVETGELDLALMIRPSMMLSPEVTWQTLRQDEVFLVLPEDVVGDDWVEQIQRLPFIRYDRTSYGGRQIDRFLRSLPLSVNDAVEVPGHCMIKMVQHGFGAALVPLPGGPCSLPKGVRAIPLVGRSLVRELGIVRSSFNERNAAIDYVCACFAAAVGPGPATAP
ncbi:MAG: LysR family transcriptional regulator [Rhodobacteraceae bacterium]|nr:LysR family transcriptional regulator [Paracoccaceae bacterium]